MTKRAPVDVFRFTDYREFLRAYYGRRKAQRGGYSLRSFSETVGLRSPNYFKLVADGDRNLSTSMATRFATACGLTEDAAAYFCTLVRFNQAKDSEERNLHYERLQRFGRFRKVHRLDGSQDAYHSQWFIPAIRELVLREDFQEDPRWIAATLMPPIRPAQASKALQVLNSLGMLKRDAQGRLRQSEALVETERGPLSHHVVSFHRTMLARAAEAIDLVQRDEREIASLTLCVADSQIAELKSEIDKFRRSLLDRYGEVKDAERVVQINLQMFPLTRRTENP